MTADRHDYWLKVVFLVYAVFSLLAIFFHEPWRDEAQAWLIARDVPIRAFFSQANYEGTPFLWHIILLPFARLGAPYLTMHLVHWMIALGMVWLFLFRSGLPFVTRLLVVFSYYAFWEYAVLARNYSLSILILFGLASLYKQRHQHPLLYAFLIGLLLNTNVHSIPIGLGLAMVFGYEAIGKRAQTFHHSLHKWGLGLIIIGLGVAIWQLWPAADNLNQGLFHIFSWKRPFIALSNAMLPQVPGPSVLMIAVASLLFASLFWMVFKRDKKVAFVLLMGCLGLTYIFVFKHLGSFRHHGLFLIFALFAMWLAGVGQSDDQSLVEKTGLRVLNVCLAISVLVACHMHYQELRLPFSGAKEAGTFLKNSVSPDVIIIAHPSIKVSAILPYLDRSTVWYADIEQMGSYVTWDTAYEEGKDISILEAVGRAQEAFPDRELVYVFDQIIPEQLDERLNLVFENSAQDFGYGEEQFFIYKPVKLGK